MLPCLYAHFWFDCYTAITLCGTKAAEAASQSRAEPGGSHIRFAFACVFIACRVEVDLLGRVHSDDALLADDPIVTSPRGKLSRGPSLRGEILFCHFRCWLPTSSVPIVVDGVAVFAVGVGEPPDIHRSASATCTVWCIVAPREAPRPRHPPVAALCPGRGIDAPYLPSAISFFTAKRRTSGGNAVRRLLSCTGPPSPARPRPSSPTAFRTESISSRARPPRPSRDA